MVKELLLCIIGALAIVVTGMLLYLGWLLCVTHQQIKAIKRRLRPPQVARDGDGRPLKERV